MAAVVMVKLQWRPYERRFRVPLMTAHGSWTVREGIILRLETADGQTRYGEIAPLPWFGTETLAAAMNYCRQLPPVLTAADINGIPRIFPATRFGLATAWNSGDLLAGCATSPLARTLAPQDCSILLGPVLTAKTTWGSLGSLPDAATVKVKIAVAPWEEEQSALQALCQDLPKDTRVRLDANGGLTRVAAEHWLQWCEHYAIEFMEQPLWPGQEEEMRQLMTHYATPIALDESIATAGDLVALADWPGIVVVKPAIVGSPADFWAACQGKSWDIVFSSVFETTIGYQAALTMALSWQPQPLRAWGFGVNHYYEDALNQATPQQIWDSL